MISRDIFLSLKILFAPYRKNIIIISIVMIITSAGSFINPWLTKQLIDFGIMDSNFSRTTLYISFMVFIFFTQQLLGLIQFHYYRDISIKIPYDLNLQACKHVLSVRVKYFKERNFSEVMSEIFQDIANISSLTDTQFLTSFVTLFKIFAGIIALFLINWKLAIIMIATIPVKLLSSSILYKKQETIFKIIMRLQSKFSVWLGDGISGISEVKIWGIINKKLSELTTILEDSKQEKSKLMYYRYVDNLCGSAISICFTCLLYLLGTLLIANKDITIGSLVSFVSYSSLVYEPISIVSYLITQLSTSIPAYERYIRFLNTEAEEDYPNSIKLPVSEDIHQISFHNVSLAYGVEKVLDDINFTINKGERIAIIGLNGSGKTSIINLLLRFYEPTEGEIKINGNNIKSFTIDSYRSILSLMSQSNYLFNDSIRNNINISGELNIDEILESSKKSGAYTFIQKFPDKFNTHVGYNGAKLSGGEKQKIALARTLSKKDTQILILDEATSSYDHYSENVFNEEILSNFQYKFLIIITHRPEILKLLDKIIYIDKGKIIGIGTYVELYESIECFKHMMINMQEGER